MDITVYLPDEIGERAKAAGLKLSRLLRGAVVRELERRVAMEQSLEEHQEFTITTEDADGKPYLGRITGRAIAVSGDVDVYLTTDQRVLVHNTSTLEHWEVDDAKGELLDFLEPGAYQQVLNALGLEVEPIDL
jgi:hypothetical protein